MNGVGVGTEKKKIFCQHKPKKGPLLLTVMMVLVEMFPLREAVQE